MKLIHKLTWIPILGVIVGFLSMNDYDGPVQTHPVINGIMHGVCSAVLFRIITA